MALIEIMVSSMLLVIVAVGVFTAFDAGTRATSEERHRARANAIAEADLERMRSMSIADLAGLDETKNVTQDGFSYSVRSVAEFASEQAKTSTCTVGTGSRDYLKISSTVTWPSIGSRTPVVARSLVSPPSGSVIPNSGSLLVQLDDRDAVGIPNVAMSGSGPSSFTGTTGPTGCILWSNLPAGNYTLNVALGDDYVDEDGNPPEPQTVSVEEDSTNTVTLVYDRAGSIEVGFETMKTYGDDELSPSQADSIIASSSDYTQAFEAPPALPPPDPPRADTITATPLFPFAPPSQYSLYAGTCSEDNPDPQGDGSGGAAIARVSAPQGGTATATIQLPALHATVYRGDNTSSGRADGATLKTWDAGPECDLFERTTTLNPVGQLDDPGFPYSHFYVCADGPAPTSESSTRRNWSIVSLDEPEDLTSPTAINIFLNGSGSQGSICP